MVTRTVHKDYLDYHETSCVFPYNEMGRLQELKRRTFLGLIVFLGSSDSIGGRGMRFFSVVDVFFVRFGHYVF